MNRSGWRVRWTGKTQSYVNDFVCDRVARAYARAVQSFGYAAHTYPIQLSLFGVEASA